MAINLPPFERDISRIVAAIRELIQGRSNSVGQVTLRENQTTTVVSAVNCSKDSEVLLTPRTANAAAALATTYISQVNQGSFTITHASNAQTDKIFGWDARGG